MTVDPARSRFIVPAAVIEQTVELLAEPGLQGFEGAALWIGHVGPRHDAHVTRVQRPAQVAYSTVAGLAVELTEGGLTDLITSLADDEIVLCRLHTHGDDNVNHSAVDDRNVVVAHPGAVSIVVPWFAAQGFDFTTAGVHMLSDMHRWRRLPIAEVKERFEIR